MNLNDNLEFSTKGQELDRQGTDSDESTDGHASSNDIRRAGAIKRDAARLYDDDYLDKDSLTQSDEDNQDVRIRRHTKLCSVLIKPEKSRESDTKLERKAMLESQSKDKQVLDRNKRMFGMLMGTLQRFKVEESGRGEQLSKRIKIEEKLEARNETEGSPTRDDLKPHMRDKLFDKANLRLDATGRFKNWEQTHRHLCGFIRTESKPRIFWKPKEHNQATEKMLKETKDYFSLCIAERAAKHKQEMQELDVQAKEPV